jgi:hypothetical protein
MKSPIRINEQSSLFLKDVVVKLSSGKVAVSKNLPREGLSGHVKFMSTFLTLIFTLIIEA